MKWPGCPVPSQFSCMPVSSSTACASSGNGSSRLVAAWVMDHSQPGSPGTPVPTRGSASRPTSRRRDASCSPGSMSSGIVNRSATCMASSAQRLERSVVPGSARSRIVSMKPLRRCTCAEVASRRRTTSRPVSCASRRARPSSSTMRRRSGTSGESSVVSTRSKPSGVGTGVGPASPTRAQAWRSRGSARSITADRFASGSTTTSGRSSSRRTTH